MKKIFTCTLLFLSSISFAETEDTYKASENGSGQAIGLGGSIFYTQGLIYQTSISKNVKFKATLSGLLSRELHYDDNIDKNEKKLTGHIGNSLNLLYVVNQYETPFSVFKDASVRVYITNHLANILQSEKTTKLKTGIGAGLGGEFFFNKHFALHLEFPFMVFVKTETIKNKTQISFESAHFHAGGGISYYF